MGLGTHDVSLITHLTNHLHGLAFLRYVPHGHGRLNRAAAPCPHARGLSDLSFIKATPRNPQACSAGQASKHVEPSAAKHSSAQVFTSQSSSSRSLPKLKNDVTMLLYAANRQESYGFVAFLVAPFGLATCPAAVSHPKPWSSAAMLPSAA